MASLKSCPIWDEVLVVISKGRNVSPFVLFICFSLDFWVFCSISIQYMFPFVVFLRTVFPFLFFKPFLIIIFHHFLINFLFSLVLTFFRSVWLSHWGSHLSIFTAYILRNRQRTLSVCGLTCIPLHHVSPMFTFPFIQKHRFFSFPEPKMASIFHVNWVVGRDKPWLIRKCLPYLTLESTAEFVAVPLVSTLHTSATCLLGSCHQCCSSPLGQVFTNVVTIKNKICHLQHGCLAALTHVQFSINQKNLRTNLPLKLPLKIHLHLLKMRAWSPYWWGWYLVNW